MSSNNAVLFLYTLSLLVYSALFCVPGSFIDEFFPSNTVEDQAKTCESKKNKQPGSCVYFWDTGEQSCHRCCIWWGEGCELKHGARGDLYLYFIRLLPLRWLASWRPHEKDLRCGYIGVENGNHRILWEELLQHLIFYQRLERSCASPQSLSRRSVLTTRCTFKNHWATDVRMPYSFQLLQIIFNHFDHLLLPRASRIVLQPLKRLHFKPNSSPEQPHASPTCQEALAHEKPPKQMLLFSFFSKTTPCPQYSQSV